MKPYTQINDEYSDMLDFAGELSSMMDTICSLGKELQEMPAALRTAQLRVQGCLSKTYFLVQRSDDGTLRIEGASESAVMRGVIYVFRDILNGQPAAEIELEKVSWWRDVALMEHLMPQRQAAVSEMLRRIKACL